MAELDQKALRKAAEEAAMYIGSGEAYLAAEAIVTAYLNSAPAGGGKPVQCGSCKGRGWVAGDPEAAAIEGCDCCGGTGWLYLRAPIADQGNSNG